MGTIDKKTLREATRRLADRLLPGQVLGDHLVGERSVFPMCASGALDSGLSTVEPILIVHAGGRVAGAPVFALPPHGVDVLPTAEELPEEADFLFRGRAGVKRSGRTRLLRGHRDWRRRNDYALSCHENISLLKKLPEGAVLRPKALHLSTEKLDFVGMHFHYNSVQPETM